MDFTNIDFSQRKIAEMNWEGLEKLCILLTLDKQIQAEAEQSKSQILN